MATKSKSEQWKDIKGFKGYQVSDKGNVRKGEKVLTPFQGRLIVLQKDGKPACRSVPRLVAAAFIGPVKAGVRVHQIDKERGYALSNLRVGGEKA